jgi:hypothetical protein
MVRFARGRNLPSRCVGNFAANGAHAATFPTRCEPCSKPKFSKFLRDHPRVSFPRGGLIPDPGSGSHPTAGSASTICPRLIALGPAEEMSRLGRRPRREGAGCAKGRDRARRPGLVSSREPTATSGPRAVPPKRCGANIRRTSRRSVAVRVLARTEHGACPI